jgi:hypothetical protein
MSRPIRTVVYCILLLLTLVWVAARVAPPPDESDEAERDVTTEKMDEVLASLRSEAAQGGRLVIVLGDSSLRWHPPLGANETLTAMLEREGEKAGVTIRVVAYDGFDAVAYYLLVDEIAALRPVAVVLTTNLQSFTDSWFGHVRMKHPQLAAFVRPTRVPQAITLPLELAGITDAALVLKPALRAIGASDVPEKIDGYRTRVRRRLDAVLAVGTKTVVAGPPVAYAAAPPLVTPPMGAKLPARRPKTGLAAPPPGGRGRVSKPAYRFMDLYPANLQPEQSTVRVLRATVHDLVARDIPTLVMLAPLHLQAARVTGAYNGRNLPQAIRVIDEMTVASGGAFLDLAEILPLESFFIDRYTHFTAEGNRIVADRLLEELRRSLAQDTRSAE